ncbi:hypothetical protein GGR06_003615 [Bacteroides reticulotermitis]|uniref:Uncharacterized protein n=1 Tax=Bacteroides reticulotermitis TaxID=1133319 RepID=A0A840DB28_9BACE|nr:hypothetical protein [Bacteroides reticulotermitis]
MAQLLFCAVSRLIINILFLKQVSIVNRTLGTARKEKYETEHSIINWINFGNVSNKHMKRHLKNKALAVQNYSKI